jgi:NADH-quinone oxidoreductase subunit M
MFFMVGVLYDRVHHRDLDRFGGIVGRMPAYSALAFGIFFAGLGLPGLCGFVGEAMVVFSVWSYSHLLALISATVVLLTAGYILWTMQRVFLGTEYHGPHGEALTPMSPRELAIGVPILALAILFGVYPHALLKPMDGSLRQTARDLTGWVKKQPQPDTVAHALIPDERASRPGGGLP